MEQRFKIGDRVRVDGRGSLGHCRTPSYLRGQTGTVVGVHGVFRDPEVLAYNRPGYPARVLYKVRFAQSEVWKRYAGAAVDQIEVDVYENWLLPAPVRTSAKPRAARKGS